MYLLRALAPRLVEQGRGTIVVITSVAACQALEGSSGYSAIVQTLRNELLGTGVNVTEIAPGLVDTEFFAQRIPNDPDRAGQMFDRLELLTPTDIARAVEYVLDHPCHVNIDRILLQPTAQGTNGRFHRR